MPSALWTPGAPGEERGEIPTALTGECIGACPYLVTLLN